ncbi:MAG: response regulator [Spirochaetes bacterium]|nr:response regulator [Spirochaetota bacterium]
MQKTIFVVDDNPTNLSVAKDALKDHYRVRTLSSAAKMFEIMNKIIPDMILLDIEMPDMDGFKALAILRENKVTSKIPVIFLTSLTDVHVEARGFEMGVIDFINKPFSELVLLNRIKTHMDIDKIIKERTARLQNLQNALVFTLADMVENRDKTTGGHIERTTEYIEILLEEMLSNDVYTEELSEMDLDLIISSARLHDVGKVSVSDVVLNKAGRLTDDEFTAIQTHCKAGERIIDNIISRSEDVEFLNYAKMIAGSHHERWDGKGYPCGLAGTDIPLQGRIVAIVDVYDALVSVRPYKNALSPDEAVEIIMEAAGTQFDPKIAEVFFKARKRFGAVK